MNKTGKVMGIIVVMLIAFFSASFIATAHAQNIDTVTFVSSPSNGGTVSPSGTQQYADSSGWYPIVATPNPGYHFVNWMSTDTDDSPFYNGAGPDGNSSQASDTLYVGTDGLIVTAVFAPNPTVSITINNQAGTGYMNYNVDNIQYSTPQTFAWSIGSIHTITGLTTIKNDGTEKYVPNMIDNGTGVRGQPLSYNPDPYTFSVPTYVEEIYMAPNTQYSVNFNVNGQGTVNPSTTTWVNPWTDETPITATPALGYTFSGWTSSSQYGDVFFTNSSAQSTTIMIGDPSTIITANFAPIPQINVAITSVTLTPVTAPVGDPSLQNIGVTVNLQNNNYVTESLNITLYSGSVWMAYSSTSVRASGSSVRTFNYLDFSNFPAGTYTITAYVTTNGLNLAPLTMTTTQTVIIQPLVATTPIHIVNVQVPQIATQQSFIMPMNVTLNNPDSASENANIQITANSISVFSTTVTLNSLQTEVIPCYFNTSILAIGNYTYTVTVTTTTLTGSPTTTATGQIGVTYLGDQNGDFTVNFKDIVAFVSEYILYYQSNTLNPACDYNHDGTPTFQDIQLFVQDYVAFTSQHQN